LQQITVSSGECGIGTLARDADEGVALAFPGRRLLGRPIAPQEGFVSLNETRLDSLNETRLDQVVARWAIGDGSARKAKPFTTK
jgi:hypothetical protein